MNRPKDTQRMPPPDATEPSSPPVPTDPGGATAPSPRVITQPLPIVTAAAMPEVRPQVDRRNATDPDIDPLLKAFDRTPVPPAPLPDERASSDGGDFVSHYAVTKPAARNEAASHDARVVVKRELRQLISEPSAEGAVVAPCEVSTEIPLARQLRRRRAALIVAISLAAAVIVIATAVATRTTTPAESVVAATTSSVPTTPPSALTVPTIAPPPVAPSSTASSPPATPSSTAIPAAPPRPSARPVQAPKPQQPDDEFEHVLPR